MFPSISRLFLHWRGPKSIAKLDGGHDWICPPGFAMARCCFLSYWGSLMIAVLSLSVLHRTTKVSLWKTAPPFVTDHCHWSSTLVRVWMWSVMAKSFCVESLNAERLSRLFSQSINQSNIHLLIRRITRLTQMRAGYFYFMVYRWN